MPNSSGEQPWLTSHERDLDLPAQDSKGKTGDPLPQEYYLCGSRSSTEVKVVLTSGQNPNHSMDGLASGFMEWLGKENVQVKFKQSKEENPKFFQYFPVYEWAGKGESWWDTPDLVVVSARSPGEWWGQHKDKLSCPIALVNEDDSTSLKTGEITNYTLVFKPQRLTTSHSDTKTNIRTLPFGAVREPRHPKPFKSRSIPIFFSATHRAGARTDLNKAISELGGVTQLNGIGSVKELHKEEYNKLLEDSMIAPAIYGGGPDTYRHWEVSYFGAMLLCQPPRTTAPNPLEDGKECIYLGGKDDIKEKLKALLADVDRLEEIARAGETKVIHHHMAIHRAQYVAKEVGCGVS